MPRAALKSVDQLAMDEEVIQNDAILTALESYQNAKEEASAASKVAREARAEAAKLLDELPLDVGTSARIGRFRITREEVKGRQVSFETQDSERIRIALVTEE